MIPTAPAPPSEIVPITLTELSLTEAERARLKTYGIERFNLSVFIAPKIAPASVPAVSPAGKSQDAPPAKQDEPVSPFGPQYKWRLYRGMYSWVHDDVKD